MKWQRAGCLCQSHNEKSIGDWGSYSEGFPFSVSCRKSECIIYELKKKKSGEKRKRERFFSGSMKCSQHSSMSCQHNETDSKLCQEAGKKPWGFKPALLLNSLSSNHDVNFIVFIREKVTLLLTSLQTELCMDPSSTEIPMKSSSEYLSVSSLVHKDSSSFFKMPAFIFAQESYSCMNLTHSEMVWLWALSQEVSPAKKFRKSSSKS